MVFSPDEIRKSLRSEPFKPMRIITTARKMFDVYHPDMVTVGHADMT
jgi:hypothetical protein